MNLPTFNIKVGDKIVKVMVCWTKEKAEKAAAQYPDGYIDLNDVLSPNYKGPATELEKQWLKGIAETLAKKDK